MKTIRITALATNAHEISPLPLPLIRRSGSVDGEGYRRQARGEAPRANFNPNAADFLRAIVIPDGRFAGLAAQRGALLNFVVSGAPVLVIGSDRRELAPGDIFLSDVISAKQVFLDVRGEARLIQIGVSEGWPGADAELPDEGTIRVRDGDGAKLKRIYKGDDEKAYYDDFVELFDAPPGEWTRPTPIAGFRMMRWENGEMDWHPCVTNQLAVVSTGELEFEVGGGGGAIETFHAGDICIAEDRTGQGHVNRARGIAYVTIIVIDTAHLWPRQPQ